MDAGTPTLYAGRPPLQLAHQEIVGLAEDVPHIVQLFPITLARKHGVQKLPDSQRRGVKDDEGEYAHAEAEEKRNVHKITLCDVSNHVEHCPPCLSLKIDRFQIRP